MVTFGNSWDVMLWDEFAKPYYTALHNTLKEEYAHRTIYPDKYDVFNALKATGYDDTKVVILGQDPYHEPGQAHGMAFSVKPGVKTPPSLANIFKEIAEETGISRHTDGNLMGWAKQGVLLLNTVLTVRAGAANSHKGIGWETFTDDVIALLNEREKPVVFLLWGANARAKKTLITNRQHMVLTAAHPSPLSAWNGFFGCGHFTKTNEFLVKNGMKPIEW